MLGIIVMVKGVEGSMAASVNKVAQEILCYLRAHPKAADTSDGIATWWLSRQRLAEALRLVEAALSELVARGEIRRHVTADGQTVYSACEEVQNPNRGQQ
jgi:hypothetical protein